MSLSHRAVARMLTQRTADPKDALKQLVSFDINLAAERKKRPVLVL